MTPAEREMVDAIATAVVAKIGAGPAPPLLNADQAGELLNLPPSWLLSEARANRVPNIRLGKYVRFRRDDLLAWIDGRSVGPRRRAA
jgi:hypothetical protein